MGIIATRAEAISVYFSELSRHGVAEALGDLDGEVLFVLDGVGGFQFAPLLVRRALRLNGDPLATVCFRWQRGLVGEIWTDLMWIRRNRLMGARLARKLLGFRRAHPKATLHVLAFSGGAGIATFAMEHLRGRAGVGTLVLACPAMSPTYNLAGALRSVERAYALVSHKDRFILGLGTKVFGTTDRKHVAGAGMRGFRLPEQVSPADRQAYERFLQIPWKPAFLDDCHYGGHTNWAAVRFLRRHLVPILRGEPLLETIPAHPGGSPG